MPRMNSLPGMLLVPGQAHLLSPSKGQNNCESAWWCWCRKLSFSVHWCWIESRRQSFGWSRRGLLYYFARQRGPQWADALKTMCREKFYSNCSKRVWSAHGHSSDGLAVRSVGVSVNNLRSNWSEVYLLVGSLTSLIFNFSHLEGVSISAK